MIEIIFVLTLIVAVTVAFVWEKVPPELVALTAVAILLLSGILKTDEFLSVLSNPAPFTIAMMFILSAGLEQSGALAQAEKLLIRVEHKAAWLVMPTFFVTIIFLSAFMNNTPLVVLMVPIGLALAKRRNINATKLLMPISFAAILGGTMTVIGTSTNLLVSDVVMKAGQPAIGMFEMSVVGIIYAMAGLAYLIFIAPFLLPNRDMPLPAQQAVQIKPIQGWRGFVPIVVIIGIMLLSAFKVLPIASLSLIGVVIILLLGSVKPENAFQAVNWQIIFLIYGMLGLSIALQKTGAVDFIVTHGLSLVAGHKPIIILAAIYILTSFLTEILSNNAVAILIAPIAISIAVSLGLDPRPFIMAVMFASSASFATPIGYQTNTYIYSKGGYRFSDFIKVGLPMNILTAALMIWLLPKFFPF